MKLKTVFLFSLFCMSLFFTNCEHKEHIKPDIIECEQLDCTKLPKVKATVRQNICGVGLWGGGYVLELADGTIIQPWSAATDEVKNFKPVVNKVISVAITEVKKDNLYDAVIRCQAVGEYENRISKTVHILCVTQNLLD